MTNKTTVKRERDAKGHFVKKVSTDTVTPKAMAPLEQVGTLAKGKRTYDKTIEQHKGRVCAICQHNGTQVPHRMSGAERWIEVDDNEFLCSACYFKSRDEDMPTAQESA